MSEWKELECEDCDNKNGLEFSTGDGDDPKSIVLCGSCSGHWKGYIIQRGYEIDFNEYFGPAYCQRCENNDLEKLRVPENIRGNASQHVLCLECIQSDKETDITLSCNGIGTRKFCR